MSDEYYVNHAIDGWPICKDGKSFNKREIVSILNGNKEAIARTEESTRNMCADAYMDMIRDYIGDIDDCFNPFIDAILNAGKDE